MIYNSYDEWWWHYCAQQGIANDKQSCAVKDAWKAATELSQESLKTLQASNDELERIDKIYKAMNVGIAEQIKEYKAQITALTQENDALRNAKIETPHSDGIISSIPCVGLPTQSRDTEYETLLGMLSAIWLEYLVRGLGFGVGIALILALFKAIFHMGVC